MCYSHGNKVTSIIAAIKGNNLCSAGIAYNAKAAGNVLWKIKPLIVFKQEQMSCQLLQNSLKLIQNQINNITCNS